MSNFERVMKKIRAAGELTDLPGHCKVCAAKVETEDHPMHDPGGTHPPLFFCSAECLADAESIFDGMPKEALNQLDALISERERETTKIH